jgi:hypothetical protein
MPNCRFCAGNQVAAAPDEIIEFASDQEAISYAQQLLHGIVEVWQGARVVIRLVRSTASRLNDMADGRI